MCSILNVQDDVWSRYIGFFFNENSTVLLYRNIAIYHFIQTSMNDSSQNNCSSSTTCTDTSGSYITDSGYSGDGISCEGIL